MAKRRRRALVFTEPLRERPAEAEKLSPIPPALASEANDLGALRGAVVDAASVSAGLWFSYLFALFYLAIAAGSVTHRDLFFESPIKLPFLSVDLPMIGFFVLGPVLFLIIHTYVLLHFVLLAGKVGVFHNALQAQVKDKDVRDRLRRQLPSNVFVQLLAGPSEVRVGVIGRLLRLVTQISLVIGPIALLLLFQLQFLPYHHQAITWFHRLCILMDLILLWMLWPSVSCGEITMLKWRSLILRSNVMTLAIASIALLLLVFTVATFPGEWLELNLPSVRFIPTEEGRQSLHELVFVGNVDQHNAGRLAFGRIPIALYCRASTSSIS